MTTEVYVRIYNASNELYLLDDTPIKWATGEKPSNYAPSYIKYIVFRGDGPYTSLESSLYKTMRCSGRENLSSVTPGISRIVFDSIFDFLDTVSQNDSMPEVPDNQSISCLF